MPSVVKKDFDCRHHLPVMSVLISEPGFPLKSMLIAGADGLTEKAVYAGELLIES